MKSQSSTAGMANDDSAADAQRYIELMRTLPMEHIGPHRRYQDPAVDTRELYELAPRVIAAVKQVDERTFEAPSAWHAAAWMLDVAEIVGFIANENLSTGLRSPFAATLGAPVFRGHRSPEWKLIPTLFRDPGFAVNSASLELFIRSLTELFQLTAEDTRANGPYVHMAAAQHYGMRTPLLDFTADPRIAVYFACHGARPDRDHQVVVYGISFGKLVGLGAAVVLPPPWVKRLYAQRGLFVDFSTLHSEQQLRDHCIRVLFPPDERFARTVLVDKADALLPPDPWYEEAICWAHAQVQTADYTFWCETPGQVLKERLGYPPFLFNALMIGFASEFMDGFVDMCEWLALQNVNGTLKYDCNAIVRLWQHNEPLLRSHRVLWRFFANQFDPLALQADRRMAAIQAVTVCLDAEARAARGNTQLAGGNG